MCVKMEATGSSKTLAITFCLKPEPHNLQLSLWVLYFFWMQKVWLFCGKNQISHQRCLPFHSLYFIYCTLHVLNEYAQGDCSNLFKILLYQSGAFLKFLYCFSKRMVLLCMLHFFLHKNKHLIVCFYSAWLWYCFALRR